MKSIIASLVIFMRRPCIDPLRSTMKTKRKSSPFDETEGSGISSILFSIYGSDFGTTVILTMIKSGSIG